MTMAPSHRVTRRWHKLCQKAVGKFLRLKDQGWPRYTKLKRAGRWQWRQP